MRLENLALYGIWMLLNYQPHCLFCQSYKLALTMSTDTLTGQITQHCMHMCTQGKDYMYKIVLPV